MLDSFVLMPNHLHGIIHITDVGAPPGRPHGAARTLGTMVAWFKSMTTNAYILGVKEEGWSAFKTRLWQRNYYEHIIRNERALDSVREYIVGNPAGWGSDPENPTMKSTRKSKIAWQV
jgi:REP element-mobilizing transposase RayT